MRAPSTDASWFGHPRGLTILFLTEMWEMFSYYGMRALLVYYMIKALAFPAGKASLIYGGYTAFVYLTPLLGGYIADRGLGRRQAVILGGSIMAAGHFMMAIPSLFFPALATIAIGNGLFLPSLPSQVRALYAPDDPRRDTAYSVYYVGINLGAFLAPLVCGTLGEVFGWHWGFGAAGVGMVVGLTVYICGGRYLPAQESVEATPEQSPEQADISLRHRFCVLFAVAALVVLFRGAYEQMGNSVAIWADVGVDRHLLRNWAIPMTWFQALNPLFVFLLTPVLVARWQRRTRAGRAFAPARKMAVGALITAAAYLFLAALIHQSEATGLRMSWVVFCAFFVLYTLGELYILPIGLSLFGRLAPRKFAATTIALWFSSAFAGNLLAGGLGALWSKTTHTDFFAIIAMTAAVPAVGLYLLDQPVRRIERADDQAAKARGRQPVTA